MSRERRIVETFVELANAMAEECEVGEFLHRLAQRSVDLLDCAEAGLMLADPGGVLRVMASSGERAESLDLLQIQNHEGPCLECYELGEAVFSLDLEADGGRWPAFASATVEKGFLSVQAVPMRVGGEPVGVLNLFRAEAGRLDQLDMPLGQGMADVAATALLQERSLRESDRVVGQLQGALGSRVAIEQAKGMLAERMEISVDAAFVALRDHARNHNRRLHDVACELLCGTLEPGALAHRQ